MLNILVFLWLKNLLRRKEVTTGRKYFGGIAGFRRERVQSYFPRCRSVNSFGEDCPIFPNNLPRKRFFQNLFWKGKVGWRAAAPKPQLAILSLNVSFIVKCSFKKLFCLLFIPLWHAAHARKYA